LIALQEEIGNWLGVRKFEHVEAVESHSVTPGNDYEVVYEVTFTPQLTDRLQLSFFATRDGYVGLGVERWERVAARTRAHILANGYVAGHEPGPMSRAQLRTILDAAAAGEICLLARPGFFGVGRKGAAVVRSKNVSPELFSGPHWKWLRVSDSPEDEQGTLKYKPW
jgi:hypothetical protein